MDRQRFLSGKFPLRYMLQIRACGEACCRGRYCPALESVLHGNFLPGPMKVVQTKEGLKIPSPSTDEKALREKGIRTGFIWAPLQQCLSIVKEQWVHPDAFCLSMRTKLEESKFPR